MAKPGDVIDVPELGLRFEFRATAESTGGAYSEVDASAPAGFIRRRTCTWADRAPHGDRGRDAREAARQGARPARRATRSRSRPTRRTTQRPAAAEPGRVRIRLTPCAGIDEFLERLGELEYNRFGFPKPSPARSSCATRRSGHAARPSLKTQQRLATRPARRREYTFVDEWDVAAPPEDVFDMLADGTTYPQWWKPVYIGVEPTTASTRASTSRAACPTTCTRARGRSTPSARTGSRARPTATCAAPASGRSRRAADGGTHVRFDWRVHADRRAAQAAHAVLRPALRWNHNWAIARAIEGLEPYVAATRVRSPPERRHRRRRRSSGPKVAGHDPRLRARPQARVLRARGRRGAGPRPRDGVQDARRRRSTAS